MKSFVFAVYKGIQADKVNPDKKFRKWLFYRRSVIERPFSNFGSQMTVTEDQMWLCEHFRTSHFRTSRLPSDRRLLIISALREPKTTRERALAALRKFNFGTLITERSATEHSFWNSGNRVSFTQALAWLDVETIKLREKVFIVGFRTLFLALAANEQRLTDCYRAFAFRPSCFCLWNPMGFGHDTLLGDHQSFMSINVSVRPSQVRSTLITLGRLLVWYGSILIN